MAAAIDQRITARAVLPPFLFLASDAMPEGSVKTITGIVMNVPRLTRNEESADRIPEA